MLEGTSLVFERFCTQTIGYSKYILFLKLKKIITIISPLSLKLHQTHGDLKFPRSDQLTLACGQVVNITCEVFQINCA